MGRRKSKRKPPQKRKAIEPLDTQFNCPFCNHEKSCEVKMDKSRNIGKMRVKRLINIGWLQTEIVQNQQMPKYKYF
ncbi:Transcription elongation factor 1 [Cinara cedri]|uniref:Transcription elongation factor 1 homolog n=1 Tax=Cinara cedri TaxID=506608 RepID=A0A5E4MEB4_9HEMI|nr:Transcription elongation factor 1 [Cinara cedri]